LEQILVNKVTVTAVLLFSFSCFYAPAWGKQEEKPAREPVKNSNAAASFPEGIIQVRGSVRLVGSMPLSSLIISDSAGQDWYVEGASRNRIAGYEQQSITVEGRAEYRDIILANGEKIGIQRFLRDIAVIDPP
jgi:hypothetical protein